MVFVESFCPRGLFLRGLLLLCAFFAPSLVHAAEVGLAWDANTESDVAGYVDVNLRLSAPYDGTKVHLIGILDATNAVSEKDETNNVVLSGLVQ